MSHTFYAKTTNAYGSSPCSSGVSYTVLAPPTPTGLSLDSPASSPGTDATPRLTVSGVASPLTVQIFTDSSCASQVGSATAYGTSASVSVSSALPFGSYTFYARTSNGTQHSACSTASVSYVLDPLPAPSSLSLAIPSSSPSYISTPTVTVAGVSFGQTAKVFTDAACTAQVGSASSSGTSVNVTTSVLAAGSHTLYAKVTDYSDGQSQCSTASLAFTVSPRASMAASVYTVAHYPAQTAAADFTGDGKLDLLAPSAQSSSFHLLVGNGDASFQAPTLFTAPNFLQAVATGDFNSDGKADFAVTDFSWARVRVYLGNGNGTFQGPAAYALTANSYDDAEGLVAADFNADGKLDLAATASDSDQIVVLPGAGDGTFLAAVTYAAGNGPIHLLSTDLNGDGAIDLAATHRYESRVSIHLNRNDGTGSLHPAVFVTVAGGTGRFGAVDLSGDGRPELLVGKTDGFTVLRNDGAGGFTIGNAVSYAGVSANAFAVGDVDGDGYLDVVQSSSSYPSNRIAIHYGKSDGSFDPPEILSLGTGLSDKSVLIRDLDADGDPEIVTTGFGSPNYLTVLRNGRIP